MQPLLLQDSNRIDGMPVQELRIVMKVMSNEWVHWELISVKSNAITRILA
jgi:hypothetical protein